MTFEAHASPGLLARAVVSFYRVWHGRWHLKGAGFLLNQSSRYLSGLQRYPLVVPGVGVVPVDFRDYTGRLWLQHLIGDRLADFDLEDGLTRSIVKTMGEDSVLWDVGGSVGMVTAAITQAMPSATIYTFEPNPFLYQALQRLFASRTNVTVFPFAFSDANGDVLLIIPIGKSVGASINGMDYVLQTAGLTATDVVQVPVRAVRGDSLIGGEAAIRPPDIVKLDVEGHEVSAVSGLSEIIGHYRPTIFFEHLYLSDEEVRGMVQPGYTLHSVDNVTGDLSAAFDRSVGHNSALVPAPESRRRARGPLA